MLKMAGQKGKINMAIYRVGVGVGGCALEFHRIEAKNQTEAYNVARSRFCSPERGFDHIEVRREKKAKGGAQK